MKFSFPIRLIIFVLPLLLSLFLLESLARVLSPADLDGNRRFRGTRLKPFHAPARKTERILRQYQESNDSALIYDPELGWAQRPNSAGHNSAGFISSEPAVAIAPHSERLRIAVFGGSYTQGTSDKGWWRVLEGELKRNGIPAEVLNFGVGGYGMDQAYLRWKRDGLPYRPQIVIFGFCGANCYDNVNFIRMIKDPDTGIPFAKPRFVIAGNDLRLLNSPTPPPSEMAAIIADPQKWPLINLDGHWMPHDFQMTWWRSSVLAALVEATVFKTSNLNRQRVFFAMKAEPSQLALRITSKFQNDVQAAGSAFFVVHLPSFSELETWKKMGHFPHRELYTALKSNGPVIAPEAAMLARCGDSPLMTYFSDGHYTDKFEVVVGKEIGAFIRSHRELWQITPAQDSISTSWSGP